MIMEKVNTGIMINFCLMYSYSNYSVYVQQYFKIALHILMCRSEM